MKSSIKQGDICIYHYADGNGSVNIVEVVDVIDSDISKIKCVQVIYDNSGNGWFKYLLKTGHTMNASNEYLHKIEPIDRLTDQLNSAINGQETLQEYIAKQEKEIERLKAVNELENTVHETLNILDEYLKFETQAAKAEAYKEFAELLKEKAAFITSKWGTARPYIATYHIDNLLKEMTENN